MDDSTRTAATLRRLRMLTGDWARDAQAYIFKSLSDEALKSFPEPNLSRNEFRDAVTRLSAFPVGPTSDSPYFTPSLAKKAKALAVRVIGLRECAIRVAVDPTGTPQYTLITPDMLTVCRADNVYDGSELTGCRINVTVDVDGVSCKGYEEIDSVRGIHRIVVEGKDGELQLSRSRLYPGLPDDPEYYPFLRRDGSRYMPVVLFHAETTENLFDPKTGEELVQQTLSVCLAMTALGQAMQEATNPLTYSVNLVAMGADNQRALTITPGQIAEFKTSGEGGKLERLEPIVSISELTEGINAFSANGAGFGGLTAAMLSPGASGEARREAEAPFRREQRAYADSLEAGFEMLLKTAADAVSGATGNEPAALSPVTYNFGVDPLTPTA